MTPAQVRARLDHHAGRMQALADNVRRWEARIAEARTDAAREGLRQWRDAAATAAAGHALDAEALRDWLAHHDTDVPTDPETTP